MTDYDACTDQELTALLKKGDQYAYVALYSKYWAQTYNNIYKRLKDHDLAEDLTQDIFLQLWDKRRADDIENLGGYLYGAARNSVYKAMEKQSRFSPIGDLLADLESRSDQADAKLLTLEFMKAYEVLIGTLPEGQQVIFRMRYHDDLSPDEIAKQLDISPKTVRNQLGKALAALRESLMILVVIMNALGK